MSIITADPGTIVSDSSNGGSPAWTNPGNAATDNGSGATYTSISLESEYLKATNYDFSLLPDAADIDGIELTVKRKSDDGNTTDEKIRLVKAGTIQSTDKKNVNTWDSSYETVTYGGASDLWSDTWSTSDIKNSGFGAALSAFAGLDVINDVDHMPITVHYTATAGGLFLPSPQIILQGIQRASNF